MKKEEIEQEVKKYRKRNVGYYDDFGYHFDAGMQYRFCINCLHE